MRFSAHKNSRNDTSFRLWGQDVYKRQISAFMDCTIAASRGLGKTVVPTLIVVMGSCVFRVIWVYTIFAHFHTCLVYTSRCV